MQLTTILDTARQADRHQQTCLHATSSLDSTSWRGAPSSCWFPAQFKHGWVYNRSPDGRNDNLMMFLHGLGDTPGLFVLFVCLFCCWQGKVVVDLVLATALVRPW